MKIGSIQVKTKFLRDQSGVIFYLFLVKRYWWLCLLIIVAYTLFLIITPFYVFPREEQTGVKWGLSLTGAMLGSYAIPNHFTFTKTWTGWWNE
jgi:hypothetical protein